MSNNGPLIRISNSSSNHSLYSNNSLHSDSPIHKNLNKQQKQIKLQKSKPIIIVTGQKRQKRQQIPFTQQTPQKKIQPKLPQIKQNETKSNKKSNSFLNNTFVNDASERYAIFNQKINTIQFNKQKIIKPNLFTKSLQKDQTVKRYPQIKSKQGERSTILNSSQGKRWVKSHSLASSKDQKAFKSLIRCYHKNGSIMAQAFNKFWQNFQQAQKMISLGPYRLSLFDTLEAIKLKMQAFLQRKINIQNYQSQKPQANWNQQQFMTYYGNIKYVLINDDFSQQIHRPFTLKKYKNCVFFGKMNDGKKLQGILHYFNGKCFEGKFKQDQKQYGIEIDQNQLYLGSFKKGLRHGEGILKTSDALHVGTFCYGQFSTVSPPRQQTINATSLFAHQIQKQSNPAFKKGFDITKNAIIIYNEGISVIKNEAGDIFIGQLDQEGGKYKQGLQIFANGDIYIGRYQSDSPQGYGEYYWQNGSFYRGQFLSGMRHGRGNWQMLNGDSYQGEYMNDKKNGKGTYLWKNGSKYVGNFQNDYRHGYGEMHWQDGRVYKGKWLNGIQKNAQITLQNPKNKIPAKSNVKPSFRTLQQDNKRKIPLDKLKSLYNPSYH